MVILNQKREGFYQLTFGTDKVIAGVAVPRGASVLQIKGHVDVMPAARVAIDVTLAYALRAYLIPLHDFDTQMTYDTLWANLVPSDDVSTETIDVDEEGSDVVESDTPGIPDLEGIMGIEGTRIQKLYKRDMRMSVASHPQHVHLDTTHFFWPAERHSININRAVRAREPSILLFGFSTPITTNTVTTEDSTPTITEWARMLVLDYTLQQMMMNFIGAVESGAQTPYVEAQALVVKLMEPKVIEQAAVAGHFLESSFNVSAKMNFKVKYPMKTIGKELTSSI